MKLAVSLCQKTGWKEPSLLGTLAAGYAECGDFGKAVELQLKANRIYPEAEDRREGEARLKLYQDGKPHRTQ